MRNCTCNGLFSVVNLIFTRSHPLALTIHLSETFFLFLFDSNSFITNISLVTNNSLHSYTNNSLDSYQHLNNYLAISAA